MFLNCLAVAKKWKQIVHAVQHKIAQTPTKFFDEDSNLRNITSLNDKDKRSRKEKF